MSSKARGCEYECKLVHLLQAKGFYSVRVAGSGCMRYPSPDIIASNGKRLIAFEVKSSQGEKVYLKQKDVQDLLEFSKGFKAEGYFAVHFLGKGWFYKRVEELIGEKVLRLDETNTKQIF